MPKGGYTKGGKGYKAPKGHSLRKGHSQAHLMTIRANPTKEQTAGDVKGSKIAMGNMSHRLQYGLRQGARDSFKKLRGGIKHWHGRAQDASIAQTYGLRNLFTLGNAKMSKKEKAAIQRGLKAGDLNPNFRWYGLNRKKK